MADVTAKSREAMPRARFFLDKARACTLDERLEFEAFLEASIIFARTAMLRMESKHEKHPQWSTWWGPLLTNPTVDFIRTERNWIVHEGSQKIGQIIFPGGMDESRAIHGASAFYYFKDPTIPAVQTVAEHLEVLASILADGEDRFS